MDAEKVKAALQKATEDKSSLTNEDGTSSGHKKRGYNSMQHSNHSEQVSVEDMEAYRMLKVQKEDPMAGLLNSEELLEYKK